jgi:hypothetical protein
MLLWSARLKNQVLLLLLLLPGAAGCSCCGCWPAAAE